MIQLVVLICQFITMTLALIGAFVLIHSFMLNNKNKKKKKIKKCIQLNNLTRLK